MRVAVSKVTSSSIERLASASHFRDPSGILSLPLRCAQALMWDALAGICVGLGYFMFMTGQAQDCVRNQGFSRHPSALQVRLWFPRPLAGSLGAPACCCRSSWEFWSSRSLCPARHRSAQVFPSYSLDGQGLGAPRLEELKGKSTRQQMLCAFCVIFLVTALALMCAAACLAIWRNSSRGRGIPSPASRLPSSRHRRFSQSAY